MRRTRIGLSIVLIGLAVACQPGGTPAPSETGPGSTQIAPEVEPSGTPEQPLDLDPSPVAPDVEPSQTPEEPLSTAPGLAPAVPSEPPEEPLDY